MEDKYCTLAADLVDHLAWPITVLILALMFKGQVRSLLNKLKKVGSGDKSAEFETVTSDKERSQEVEGAIKSNNVEAIHRIVQQLDLRLLAALSCRNKELPLTVYTGKNFNAAKKNILQLGLATFSHGRFKITELGLNVLQKKIEERLKEFKNVTQPVAGGDRPR